MMMLLLMLIFLLLRNKPSLVLKGSLWLMHLEVMMMGILKMMVFLMMNLLMSSGRVRLKPNELI